MSKRNMLLAIFAVVALAQLSVPLSMISKREMVLKNGVQYKFKTAPVDPYDAFRGKYVALRMDEGRVKVPDNKEYNRNQKVYALIELNDEGFATFSDLSAERPETGDYVKVKVHYRSNSNNVNLKLPFNRYYMNEEDAPKAEIAYREHSRRTNHNAHITVRVKRGYAVIENLYIGDKRVEDYIKEDEQSE